MKTIRLIAGMLLVISGVLHLVMYIKIQNDDPGSIGTLIFGIIYGTTGLLLFTKQKYPVYLAVIFPLIGMTIALIKFGFPALTSLMALLVLIDILVIIGCGYILMTRK